ncbi:MAG: hypothetical protein EBT86_04260 [Actinobacteria bacterium]|nr:hypothetical protein [Actinomycetota bacterium]
MYFVFCTAYFNLLVTAVANNEKSIRHYVGAYYKHLFGICWLSAPFKPPYYSQQFEGLPEKWKKIVRTIDIFALLAAIVFVLSPFFLY